MRDKLLMLAWVTPFVTILAGVMIVLYAGLATPLASVPADADPLPPAVIK